MRDVMFFKIKILNGVYTNTQYQSTVLNTFYYYNTYECIIFTAHMVRLGYIVRYCSLLLLHDMTAVRVCRKSIATSTQMTNNFFSCINTNAYIRAWCIYNTYMRVEIRALHKTV